MYVCLCLKSKQKYVHLCLKPLPCAFYSLFIPCFKFSNHIWRRPPRQTSLFLRDNVCAGGGASLQTPQCNTRARWSLDDNIEESVLVFYMLLLGYCYEPSMSHSSTYLAMGIRFKVLKCCGLYILIHSVF
jgi:hypothetical protein